MRSIQHFQTAAAPTALTSVTTKELQETVDYANKQGRKTPSGQPFTVEYLKKHFEDQKVKVLP